MFDILDDKGGISKETINKYEEKWNVKLPIEYKEFLSKYNGGYPSPDVFDIPEIEDASSVDRFLGIEIGQHSNMDDYYSIYLDRIPNDIFPIAHDPGGNLICIGVKGENTGKIFFWDHEFEADENEPDYSNVHLIGESFNLFLDSLYEVNID